MYDLHNTKTNINIVADPVGCIISLAKYTEYE